MRRDKASLRACLQAGLGLAVALACLSAAPSVAQAGSSPQPSGSTTGSSTSSVTETLSPSSGFFGSSFQATIQVSGGGTCAGTNPDFHWVGKNINDDLGTHVLDSNCSTTLTPPRAPDGDPGSYLVYSYWGSGSVSASYTVEAYSGAGQLSTDSTSGAPGDSLTATYQYSPGSGGQPCPPDSTVEFSAAPSSGSLVNLGQVPLSANCEASWSGSLPFTTPGIYSISAAVTPPYGGSIARDSTDYTIDVVGASLSDSPQSGVITDSLQLDYFYTGSTCTGTAATFYLGGTKPGSGTSIGHANLGTDCSATWTGALPDTTAPGPYLIWAQLLQGNGSAVPGSGASVTYTVLAEGAAAPTSFPTFISAATTLNPSAVPTPTPSAVVEQLALRPDSAKLPQLKPIDPMGLPSFDESPLVWVVLILINAAALGGIVLLRRRWSEQIVD